MARLYSNENFPLPVVLVLRKLGHDVLTVQEAGKANQGIPDPEVLRTAAADGRAVITFNRRHFIKLHQQSSNHAGIIACKSDRDVEPLANRINQAIADRVLTGQLIRVNRK